MYVYLIFDKNTRLTKIGKSVNPEKRLHSLKISAPHLELIFFSDQFNEKDLHDKGELSAALNIREKRPFDALPPLASTIRRLEEEFGAQGRVLVRYSGTESKLRLLVEGPTIASVESGIARLRAAVVADGSV